MTTHRKDIEQANLRVIKQLSGPVLLLSAGEFQIKYASEAYRKYFPETFKDNDLIGISFADHLKEGEGHPLISMIRRISENGKGEEIRDHRITNGEGMELWVDWVGSPIDNGTDRWDVLLQPSDITERKSVEEALKESERQLSTLIGNLPGMAFRCKNDRDYTMEFVSEGCWDLLEYPPAELTSHRISWNDLILLVDREMVWEGIQVGIREKGTYHVTYRIRTRSGNVKWIWEKGKGVYAPSGEVIAIEGIAHEFERPKAAVRARRFSGPQGTS